MRPPDSLDLLRQEVEDKRQVVARLEQERVDLELEIAAFEAAYNAEVKPLQDELDALNLHIKEYEARSELLRFRGKRISAVELEGEVELRVRGRPEASQATSPPHTRRAWADASAPADPDAVETDAVDPDAVAQAAAKSLYRELAKRFHPDLAADGAEREARGARMAEINAAYARHDLEELRRVAQGSAAQQPDPRPHLPPTLAELLAERDRLEALIIRLRQELAELNRDPLLLLKLDAALARHSGHDLLAALATDIHIQIVERRGALNRLIAEFRALVEQVGLV